VGAMEFPPARKLRRVVQTGEEDPGGNGCRARRCSVEVGEHHIE
jgi:hypothetical protein